MTAQESAGTFATHWFIHQLITLTFGLLIHHHSYTQAGGMTGSAGDNQEKPSDENEVYEMFPHF